MKDYSQSGEQQIILDYFKPPTWPYLIGRFLDIGANDGETLSNTRLLALAGWDGVCVEPAPMAYAKLAQLYKNEDAIWTVNAAITPADGPVELWESGTHFNQGDTGLLSTIKESEVAQWSHLEDKFIKTVVRGITFKTLMEECGNSRFDFISIDCEGVDYEVLAQIDLRAVGCRMLCVEFNGKEEEKYVEYAARYGLNLHGKNQHNLIFAL